MIVRCGEVSGETKLRQDEYDWICDLLQMREGIDGRPQVVCVEHLPVPAGGHLLGQHRAHGRRGICRP